MGEIRGIAAALISSALGGTSIAATRSLVGILDPLALGAFRFGIGFAFLAPIALMRGERWPPKQDWLGVAGLGALFFGLFPILFNASLVFTTSARAALALATLPLLTMVAAAMLRVEALTTRKAVGVGIAMAGVAISLITGFSSAPAGAWKGDLLMVAAALCMSLYTVWSRPFIRRSGALPFATIGMSIGAFTLICLSLLRGSFAPVSTLDATQWIALAYLGVFGSAVTFFLWAFALAHTTPTRVAISVTVNPISASLVGAIMLAEPIGLNILLGVLAVLLGIWIAAATSRMPVCVAGGRPGRPP